MHVLHLLSVTQLLPSSVSAVGEPGQSGEKWTTVTKYVLVQSTHCSHTVQLLPRLWQRTHA